MHDYHDDDDLRIPPDSPKGDAEVALLSMLIRDIRRAMVALLERMEMEVPSPEIRAGCAVAAIQLRRMWLSIQDLPEEREVVVRLKAEARACLATADELLVKLKAGPILPGASA
jgi:hypothetical protein